MAVVVSFAVLLKKKKKKKNLQVIKNILQIRIITRRSALSLILCHLRRHSFSQSKA